MNAHSVCVWILLISNPVIYVLSIPGGSVMDARAVGMVGLVKFYVEFHGTVVYFTSYFLNKRYVGFSKTEVALFVGFSNGLWFFFPLAGIYACACMIQSNSFAVLR